MTDYSYRHLTSEQRAEVLRQRSAKGYPFHTPPHPYREAGYYAITAANYEHQSVMASCTRCTNFETMLLEALRKIDAEVVGWVILPNHYHILIGIQNLDDFSAIIQRLHDYTSRLWNIEDELTGKRKVWYRFYDRQIRNDQHLNRALNYIHYNPVKHQCITEPYEWPWTSLHNYFEEKGRQWLRQQWSEYPLEKGISSDFQE